MTASDVLHVLDLFKEVGIDAWIGGGWGIDALVGRQTRDHRDLDLVFARDSERQVVRLLVNEGFTETLDWRPVRFVMTDGTREIDLHPAEFMEDGSAVQQGLNDQQFDYPAGSFVQGTIEDRTVPCISATLQWTFHQGYEPTARDRHDLALLADLLGSA